MQESTLIAGILVLIIWLALILAELALIRRVLKEIAAKLERG